MTNYTIITGKIARGTLPGVNHNGTSLSSGNGRPCDGCDETMLAANTEVAVAFTQGPALRFHLDCFGVWCVAARAAAEQIGVPTSRRRPAVPRARR